MTPHARGFTSGPLTRHCVAVRALWPSRAGATARYHLVCAGRFDLNLNHAGAGGASEYVSSSEQANSHAH